jgi:hypothetical protein
MSMNLRGSTLFAIILIIALAGCSGGGRKPGPSGGNPPPVTFPAPSNTPFWAQWGADSQHSGLVGVSGQASARQLADIVYDSFVPQAQLESGGDLLSHYQAPLIDGNDVYIMVKSGAYTACNPHGNWVNGAPCGPNAWNSMVWNEARYTWINNTLTKVWTFASDWKPEPNGQGLGGWEPVFHPVDANNFIYVPGVSGTIWKVKKTDGTSAGHINPFAGTNVDAANTYVSGPLTADSQGNIYYDVIQLAPPNSGDPWADNDVAGAWLVKVTAADVASSVSYATLIPNAPLGSSNTCPGRFTNGQPLPWPPTVNAVPNSVACGSQRPGVNIAPAVAPDGTIYTASRAHFDSRMSYLVAVNPNLTPKWAASMQNVLTDGCGVSIPIEPSVNSGLANHCRFGTNVGVDPTTNAFGSGAIPDQGSSSPTVLPDGSVLFGALTSYNGARGHLFKYDAQGTFVGAYDFGWDSTPALWQHGGTYSIVIKDNHYEANLYCGGNALCQVLPDGPYYITQLDSNLNIDWQFKSTNTQSCQRNANGTLSCVSDHPNGFEWCINMPAVDKDGNVYANSEDGNIYIIPQGNTGIFSTPKGTPLFLNLAIGAAYTPLSIGPDGRIYTQNDGHLFVAGN